MALGIRTSGHKAILTIRIVHLVGDRPLLGERVFDDAVRSSTRPIEVIHSRSAFMLGISSHHARGAAPRRLGKGPSRTA